MKPAIILACLTLTGGTLNAEGSDYPLALNLPTTQRMQYWDLSVAFTYRFEESVQGHSKDWYGLDGFAYPAFGLDLGIKPVPGLNFQVYRTTGEFYPRPSKLDKRYKPGWAAGFAYKTFKHRFTPMATNTAGTTAHQVLGGDYRGGPGTYGAEQGGGKWSLGFNIVRIF